MIQSNRFSPLSRFLGTQITDAHGVIVGHVTEILVDEADGRLAYVQIHLGHDVENCRNQVTVPYSTISANKQSGETWQLRVAKSALVTLARASRP